MPAVVFLLAFAAIGLGVWQGQPVTESKAGTSRTPEPQTAIVSPPWNPMLQYNPKELIERMKSIITIEDHFAFQAEFGRFLLDVNRSGTMFYHGFFDGDRSFISQHLALLLDRPAGGGWTLIETATVPVEPVKHVIPNRPSVYILRGKSILHVADLRPEDVVFVTSENTGAFLWPQNGDLSVTVAPSAWPPNTNAGDANPKK